MLAEKQSELLLKLNFSVTCSWTFVHSHITIVVTVSQGPTHYLLSHSGGPNHIETNPLICSANQWIGFYMIETSVMKELISFFLKQRGNQFEPHYVKPQFLWNPQLIAQKSTIFSIMFWACRLPRESSRKTEWNWLID